MRYIQEIESPENVRILVVQDLKELGIKIPKAKKNKSKEESVNSGNPAVFGNYLNMVPCLMVEECGPVPKFLIQATQVLDKHIDVEGLFRKSGSVARQKELKTKIELNEDLVDANPLDIASLIKQFFRELPDPLFTSRLNDTFLKCYSLESEDARVTAILLLCHQLPWHHLSTLRYMMLFLQKVAHNCDLNKMDIANLAVCITPNLMHNNMSEKKSDKMNMTESKWLQIQTNIVQLLILYAGDIGMVPDSLYERSLLMSACFPNDDDLERSEAVNEEYHSKSSAKKKKKKRSGSLQGLVSNLSSSFSKWRKDNRGHNASSISDRSAISYLSFDKSSMANTDQIDLSQITIPQADEFLNPEATPKVIRKRKAEDEAVPFSASRKKAILQHMPQMATLGNTPFTPVARRGRYPRDFQETPNIKFADSDNMVFNGGSTPSLVTPKRKMDKLFSPYSTTKVKRQSSGKSGCFSPKTAKGSMRKSVRGFFRRLSGGKDPVPNPSGIGHVSISGKDGSNAPDGIFITESGIGQKKKTMFGRHRKTPSSPARLVTNIAAELKREKVAMASRGSSASSVKNQEINGSFVGGELMSHRGSDLSLRSPIVDLDKTPIIDSSRVHCSNLSMDSLGTSLRRGKPNTVNTGLPIEYHKRRSLDIDSFAVHDDENKEIESIANTLDTSPILKEHQNSPHCEDGDDLNNSSEMTPKCISDEVNRTCCLSVSSLLSCQLSKSSITSKLEESLNNPTESGLDQAFINESVLADVTNSADGVNKCVLDDIHMTSPTSDTECQYTVKYSCVDVSVVQSNEQTTNQPKSKGNKVDVLSQHSVDSVDSAIGSDTGAGASTENYKSTVSLQSCDSGLSVSSDAKSRCKLSVKSDSNLSFASGKQNEESEVQTFVTPCRTASEPSLRNNGKTDDMTSSNENVQDDVSNKEQKVMRDSILNLHQAGKVSIGVHRFADQDKQQIEKRKESPHRFCNSPIRRLPNSPVRIPTIFAKSEKEALYYRDIARLGSCSRTGSIRRPRLPISTNLVRADSVQRCKLQLHGSEVPDTPVGQPGHTPGRVGPHCALRLVEINPDLVDASPKFPLHENNRVNVSLPDSVTSTPKIKQRLTSDRSQLVFNRSATPVTVAESRHSRMPVKPLKRLQASPVSPHSRRHSRSPRRPVSSPCKSASTIARCGISPLPTSDPNWNI